MQENCNCFRNNYIVRSYFIDFTDMNFAAAIDNALYSYTVIEFQKDRNMDMISPYNLVDFT